MLCGASGTPYLVGISPISRDNHEIAKDEPQTEEEILHEQVRAFMGIVEQTERSEEC